MKRLKFTFPIAGAWLAPAVVFAQSTEEWGIEGMRSKEFSIGIFIFLIICIGVFGAIVIKFMRSGKGKSLKTGEKIMFGWIFLGILFAIFLGVSQILYGNLL
jgi:hypothetical protein